MARRRNSLPRWLTDEIGGMPIWGIMASLVVIIALGATALIAMPQQAPARASAEQTSLPVPSVTPTEVVEPPTAVFLGDSFTEASQVEDNEAFAVLVSEHFGWRLDNRGQGGTGYLNSGPEQFPERDVMANRVQEVVSAAPEVVVVAAGINDQQLVTGDGAAFRAAVQATLQPLRDGLPEASIYVVGPFWPNGYPNERVLLMNEIVAEEAAALGLPFVDPVGGQWITGSNDGVDPGNRVEYIGEDGTHPTAAGQAWIAEQMIASLTAAGVTPPA